MEFLSTIQKPREAGDIIKKMHEIEKKIQSSSEMELREELAFAKQRIMKRRIMEAQVQQGGGGGEVRRVHVIYFLSRKGRVEHPHLIRVHHLSRNGVRLRDVKRWLSELRGKDMPESFAWSYKRKYKAGYVWQDLLDEDLITPISDNEYVLKGSEIASAPFNNDKCSYGEKKASNQKKSTPQEVEGANDEKTSSNVETGKIPESPLGVSPKTSCEIEQESPLFGSETSSSLTDDSTKPEKDKHSTTTKQEEEQNGQKDKKENNSDNTGQNNNKEGDDVNSRSSTSFKNSSAPNCSVGKSSSGNSGGTKQSNMFRNWITCGAVETNESAVMVINRRNRTSLGVFSNKEKNYKGEIFKGDKLGGSERMAAHSWLLEQHHEASARKSFDDRTGSKKSNKDEFGERKTVSAAYKPINRPKCSQCGRQFKPEKLHTHMKSCRGMKSMAKCATSCPKTSDKTPLTKQDDPCHQDSASSFYLTNNK